AATAGAIAVAAVVPYDLGRREARRLEPGAADAEHERVARREVHAQPVLVPVVGQAGFRAGVTRGGDDRLALDRGLLVEQRHRVSGPGVLVVLAQTVGLGDDTHLVLVDHRAVDVVRRRAGVRGLVDDDAGARRQAEHGLDVERGLALARTMLAEVVNLVVADLGVRAVAALEQLDVVGRVWLAE